MSIYLSPYYKESQLNKKYFYSIFASVFILTSCSSLDPFVDRRRIIGAEDREELYTGESKDDLPVICYNSLTTTPAEVQKLANDECVKNGTGSHAKFLKQEKFKCRLLLPHYLLYQCIK